MVTISLELLPNGPVNLLEMSRVPCIGELIALDLDGPAMVVRAVYHTPLDSKRDAIVRVAL